MVQIRASILRGFGQCVQVTTTVEIPPLRSGQAAIWDALCFQNQRIMDTKWQSSTWKPTASFREARLEFTESEKKTTVYQSLKPEVSSH